MITLTQEQLTMLKEIQAYLRAQKEISTVFDIVEAMTFIQVILESDKEDPNTRRDRLIEAIERLAEAMEIDFSDPDDSLVYSDIASIKGFIDTIYSYADSIKEVAEIFNDEDSTSTHKREITKRMSALSTWLGNDA